MNRRITDAYTPCERILNPLEQTDEHQARAGFDSPAGYKKKRRYIVTNNFNKYGNNNCSEQENGEKKEEAHARGEQGLERIVACREQICGGSEN